MKSFIPHAVIAAILSRPIFQIGLKWKKELPEELLLFNHALSETKIRFTAIFLVSYALSSICLMLGVDFKLEFTLIAIVLCLIWEIVWVSRVLIKHQLVIKFLNRRKSDSLYKKSITAHHLSFAKKVLVPFFIISVIGISAQEAVIELKDLSTKLQPGNITFRVEVDFK